MLQIEWSILKLWRKSYWPKMMQSKSSEKRNIYGSLNMQWEDEIFKYIIDQKVENISVLDWEMLLKEKPFLTRKQISAQTYFQLFCSVRLPSTPLDSFRFFNDIRIFFNRLATQLVSS